MTDKHTENLYDIPDHLPVSEEFFELLAAGDDVRIERIISHGHHTPEGNWYNQEKDEWVILLQGEAELEWKDGDRTELNAGDWLMIPAHREHRVASTSEEPPCIWLAIHGNMTLKTGKSKA